MQQRVAITPNYSVDLNFIFVYESYICYQALFGTLKYFIFSRLKDIGQTVGGHKGPGDNITLLSQKFEIGDFMDVAISIPREGRRMY